MDLLSAASVATSSELFSGQNIIAFLTLAILEIVLGIDNIVFIAILTAKLPQEKQQLARQLGLALAMVMRILLLLAISWVMGLTNELFKIGKWGFSGKDLILLGGGLFLLAKSTHEIHEKIEEAGHSEEQKKARAAASFGAVIVQIMLLDIVFSLDSVITAVGMVQHISIMIAAVIAAVAVMMIFSGPISRFVHDHPTIKILALSFLILIGVMLVAEGFGEHIPKGYIYFAMAFSLMVEMINLRIAKKRKKSAGAA
ncbi:MAG TPA: TerC family protein [Candidatus Sumerlaeota bacterium]|nr:TerC family protein [Candidatus Sumerlaeota bacterium]